MYRMFPHAFKYDTDVEPNSKFIVKLCALARRLNICVEFHERARQRCLRHRMVHERLVNVLQFKLK